MVTSEPGKYAMAATATSRKHRGLGILGMGNRGFLWIYDDFMWFYVVFMWKTWESFWEDFMNLMFWKAGTVIVESWTFSESLSVMDKSETVEMGWRPNNWSWQCWQFQGGVLVQHIFLHISSNWAGNKQSLDLKTWKCSSPQKGLGWFLARVLPRRTRSAPGEPSSEKNRINGPALKGYKHPAPNEESPSKSRSNPSQTAKAMKVAYWKWLESKPIQEKTSGSGFRQDKTALGRHCWVIWGAFRKVMSNLKGPTKRIVGGLSSAMYIPSGKHTKSYWKWPLK